MWPEFLGESDSSGRSDLSASQLNNQQVFLSFFEGKTSKQCQCKQSQKLAREDLLPTKNNFTDIIYALDFEYVPPLRASFFGVISYLYHNAQ